MRSFGRFVPPALRREREQARRAHLLVGVVLLTSLSMSLRVLSFWRSGEWLQLAASAGGVALMLASLLLLSRVAAAVLASNLFALGLFLPGLLLALRHGGLDAPIFVALSFIPLLVTMTAGRRSGLAWALLVASSALALGAMKHFQVQLPVSLQTEPRFGVRLIGLLVLPLAVYGVALVYEWTKDSAIRAQRQAEADRAAAEATAELMRTDRIMSMGQLVAGVAHEINNPLTYVIGSLEAMRASLDAPGDANQATLLDDLDQAQKGLERIQTIVRDLKTFTRPAETEETLVDVGRVIEMSVRIAEVETRHRAQLVVDFADPLPKVRAIEGHLGQIILNLLINSAQAIEEGEVEKNRIEVSVARTSSGDLAIAVRDTGCGMPESVRQRALEPLFTTKPVGTGTGLGLSVCGNIVKDLGGAMDIESAVGEGTTVRVVIPSWRVVAADQPEPVARAAARSWSPRDDLPEPRDAYDVLVIDDDRLVARAVARMLRSHHIEVVNSGERGVELIQRGRSFDVILCDLMMPSLSGMDVYERLKKLAPGVEKRMVFLTGGVLSERTRQFVEHIKNPLLEKPVSSDVLRRVIAQVASATTAARA